MYEKEFSTDETHVIVHVTRQSRNMGVCGTARLGAECSLFHSELQRLFETEGAGEGEISLIARVASQAGLFSELNTLGGGSSFEKAAKKMPPGGIEPPIFTA